MRLWIDATQPESWSRIFGMTLVERQLRALTVSFKGVKKLQNAERKLGRLSGDVGSASQQMVAKVRPSEIWVELPDDAPARDWIPEDLAGWPIREIRSSAPIGQRLEHAIETAKGEPVVAFSGDCVIDQRIIDNLLMSSKGSVACVSDEGPESGAVLLLTEPLPSAVSDEANLLDIARSAIKGGHVSEIQIDEMATFINKLRRDLVPYLTRVTSEQAGKRVERFLFDASYKGATDLMTKWAYPPIVWQLTTRLAERRVTPTAVTVVGMIACFGSIPFFAAGMWVPGLLLAYVMSVLDSVDGKLARTTFSSSAKGDVLDHGTDTVHPPLWYGAWGWGLSGGDFSSPAMQAAMWMTGWYVLDRLTERLFKAATGYSVHSYKPIDATLRTVVSRRNPNLLVFTLALPLGLGIEAMVLMAGWQVATTLFHLSRVILYWNTADDPRAIYKEAA